MKRIIIIVLVVSMAIVLFPETKALAVAGQGQFLIINKSTNQLAYFQQGQLVKIFPVATGRKDSLTPEGLFTIVNKIKNRPYYKEGIAGGDPRNPLGNRWLGLDALGTYGTTYAIHGNSNPASIGTYVSAGCIRMHNDDVHWLFEEIQLPTLVLIGHYSTAFEEVAVQVGYQLLPAIEVFVNGAVLELKQPPIMENNRVLVPLRTLFTSLGAKVSWDEKTKTVTAVKGQQKVTLSIGATVAVIDDKEVSLDVPAQLYNGRTFIPVRFVAQALGESVKWDQVKRSVTIETAR